MGYIIQNKSDQSWLGMTQPNRGSLKILTHLATTTEKPSRFLSMACGLEFKRNKGDH